MSGPKDCTCKVVAYNEVWAPFEELLFLQSFFLLHGEKGTLGCQKILILSHMPSFPTSSNLSFVNQCNKCRG